MKKLRAFGLMCAVMLATVTLVAGCANRPQSVDESLGAAETQLAAAERSVAAGVNSGTLTMADKAQAQSFRDQARLIIKDARTAEATGDMSTAQGKLAALTTLLGQLSAYLAKHGVPQS